jgi:hypothetical protein
MIMDSRGVNARGNFRNLPTPVKPLPVPVTSRNADPAHGLISWISPIAQALIGHSVGDEVSLQGQRAEITRLDT